MDMDKIAMLLAIIGAINWGFVGILNMNLVEMIFGSWAMVVRLIYALVGISGLLLLKQLK